MDPKALPPVVITICGDQESIDHDQKFEIVVDDWNFAEDHRISSNLIVRNANTGEVLLEESSGMFSVPIVFIDPETFEDATRTLILDFACSDAEKYALEMSTETGDYSFNGKCAEVFYHFQSELEMLRFEAEYKLLYGEVDYEKVGYIFEAALYHSIDYWARFEKIERNGKLCELIDVRDVSVLVIQDYQDEYKQYTIYPEDLWRGMVKAAAHKDLSVEEWEDNHDAFDADMAVQYAIFEEVRYG